MCGVTGIYNFDQHPVDRQLLQRMTDLVAHRGPDDSGLHLDGAVGLGHRRLSILDLSTSGHQPMCGHSGRVWISYNGECYNHLEL
ncbi:MAG: asparagine synthetase B, partial [bacterium]